MYCYKLLRQMSINTVKHIVAIYQYCEAYRFNKKQGLLILWVSWNATQSDSDTVTDICLLILCDIQHIEHWTHRTLKFSSLRFLANHSATDTHPVQGQEWTQARVCQQEINIICIRIPSLCCFLCLCQRIYRIYRIDIGRLSSPICFKKHCIGFERNGGAAPVSFCLPF